MRFISSRRTHVLFHNTSMAKQTLPSGFVDNSSVHALVIQHRLCNYFKADHNQAATFPLKCGSGVAARKLYQSRYFCKTTLSSYALFKFVSFKQAIIFPIRFCIYFSNAILSLQGERRHRLSAVMRK